MLEKDLPTVKAALLKARETGHFQRVEIDGVAYTVGLHDFSNLGESPFKAGDKVYMRLIKRNGVVVAVNETEALVDYTIPVQHWVLFDDIDTMHERKLA